MASLSATLIVRDEERYLSECLRSIRDLVDEIVVVDTGSSDGSVEIARAHGARVFTRPWDKDFAAARNAALARAHSEWILYIDADERVRPGKPNEVRMLLADSRWLGLYVRFYPRTGYTPYREMRLFRNRGDIRFEGVIHENIWPALERHMRTHGGEIGESSLIIDHRGYDGDQNAKHARNLPLLQRALEADPDRVYCWYHLGAVHQAQGQTESARSAWQAGIEVVRRRGSLAGGSLPYIHLIEMELQCGHADRALLEEAKRTFPEHAYLVWLDGRICLLEERHGDALTCFERLLHWPVETDVGTAYDRRLFEVQARVGLATCHLAVNDYARAKQQFALAEAAEPDCLEWRVKRQLCEHLAAKAGPSQG